MTQRNRTYLKGKFETGDTPTQTDFSDKIDSQINILDDVTNGTSKATPVDADKLTLSDSAASDAIKTLSWANIKATLKTYFDTLYSTVTDAFSKGSDTLDDITDGSTYVKSQNDYTDAEKTNLGNQSGTNTGDQSAGDFNHDDLANITGTASEYNHPTDANMVVLGNTSGTNTGDMSDAEVKTAYENNANTNALTDAEKTVLGNTSGTNTGDQDISGKADKSNVLELDNTDSFTPDADYEPATKKYVDDNAGGGDFADGGEAGGADRSLGNTDNFDLSFLTNNTERITVKDDGDIIVNSGQIKMPNGSASAPSLSFSGDTDSGFYRSGNPNTFSIALGGASKYQFKSSQFIINPSIDVIIHSGNLSVGGGYIAGDTALDVSGATTQRPLSSDPSDPGAGNSVQWVSDGTGSGDAGDVMMKINVGGTTKTVTLVDYSTLS